MKPDHVAHSLDPRIHQAKQKEQTEKKALLDRAFDRIIGSQLHKILTANNAPTEQDESNYRETLERERAAAAQRKTKKLSREHAELARTTGLSGQVVALMAQVDEKKRKRKNKKRSRRDHGNDSNNSSSSEDFHERKKRRHKEKKRRRKHESSSDSDSSDSDESKERSRRKKEKKRKRSKSRSLQPEGERREGEMSQKDEK